MKGRLLIVFCSKHGYVRRYVDIIGNAIGCDAVPSNKLRAEMLADYDKVLYIGSLKGDEINGLKKFAEFYDIVYKKLVICAVGLSPFRRHIPQRVKESAVSVAYEKFVPVFYAQGGFDVDELSRLEKFAISWRVKQIKTASVISDEDTFLMNALKQPVDEVKIENVQPLIDYLEGRPVDEALYSPPEITDAEEEKKFFEELERAVDAPMNQKRALKKKLKKSVGKSNSAQPEAQSDAQSSPADNMTKEQPQDASEPQTADNADTADVADNVDSAAAESDKPEDVKDEQTSE